MSVAEAQAMAIPWLRRKSRVLPHTDPGGVGRCPTGARGVERQVMQRADWDVILLVIE